MCSPASHGRHAPTDADLAKAAERWTPRAKPVRLATSRRSSRAPRMRRRRRGVSGASSGLDDERCLVSARCRGDAYALVKSALVGPSRRARAARVPAVALRAVRERLPDALAYQYGRGGQGREMTERGTGEHGRPICPHGRYHFDPCSIRGGRRHHDRAHGPGPAPLRRRLWPGLH